MLANQDFNDSLKKDVKRKLVDALVNGLRTEKLSLKDMKISSNFILDKIDLIKNLSQLIVFLDELSQKWPVFSEVLKFYKFSLSEEKEKEVIDKLSQYIKHLS